MRQRTTPGQLCRIKAPRPRDEEARARGYDVGPDGMLKDIGEPVAGKTGGVMVHGHIGLGTNDRVVIDLETRDKPAD